MLVVMPLVQGIYTAVAPHGFGGLLLRGLFAAICLIPPTVMMGATLPAVARWVETTPRGVSWLGFFYGGNTSAPCSAACWPASTCCACTTCRSRRSWPSALNLAVAVAAWTLARIEPRTTPAPPAHRWPATRPPSRAVSPRDARLIYLAIAPVRDERAGRRGGVDAPVLAAAQRDHLHVFDHPGGVPDRHRPGQRRRRLHRAADGQPAARARHRAAAAGRGDRLDELEHHDVAPVLADQPAAGAESLDPVPDRSGALPVGDPARPPACGAPASRSRWRRWRRRARTAAWSSVGSTRPTPSARSSARSRSAWCSSGGSARRTASGS